VLNSHTRPGDSDACTAASSLDFISFYMACIGGRGGLIFSFLPRVNSAKLSAVMAMILSVRLSVHHVAVLSKQKQTHDYDMVFTKL